MGHPKPLVRPNIWSLRIRLFLRHFCRPNTRMRRSTVGGTMRRSEMLIASGLLLCCIAESSAGAAAEEPALKGLPGKLEWLNAPAGWNVTDGRSLTIQPGKQTDWFVDPFNGETHKNAPIL